MLKKELVQTVLDLAGLEFGHRTAAIAIGQAFNQVVGQLFSQDNGQFQFYCKRVTLPVSNRVAVIDIPIIQCKTNGSGVPRIMPSGADNTCLADDTVFMPMALYALQSSVDANHISTFIFYTVENNQIRFNDSLPKGVTEVLADVVPEFQYYDDNDNVSLPAGVSQIIIDSAVSMLRKDPSGNANIYKKK